MQRGRRRGRPGQEGPPDRRSAAAVGAAVVQLPCCSVGHPTSGGDDSARRGECGVGRRAPRRWMEAEGARKKWKREPRNEACYSFY